DSYGALQAELRSLLRRCEEPAPAAAPPPPAPTPRPARPAWGRTDGEPLLWEELLSAPRPQAPPPPPELAVPTWAAAVAEDVLSLRSLMEQQEYRAAVFLGGAALETVLRALLNRHHDTVRAFAARELALSNRKR